VGLSDLVKLDISILHSSNKFVSVKNAAQSMQSCPMSTAVRVVRSLQLNWN
jgi:hypothetical protein